LDLHGNHIFVNPAAAKMLGYEAEELIGRPSHSTWHHTKPDGSPYPKEECQIYTSFLDGAVHRSSIEVFWRKDGTSFPVEYASTPIYEQGRLAGTVVTFADITERKRAEEQIRLASEEWEMTFNSITDLVFIQDKDFTIKKVNKTFAAALKMNPKDIIGKKCYDILHNLDHPWPGCPLKKAKQDGASHTEEVNDPHIGIPLLVTASPIIDANGEIIGAVHIARDITERKNKEKLILDVNQRLEEVSEELSAAKRDLEQKNEALQKVCSELQQRVNEQTAQLAAANRSLGDKGYYK
jgi:PAS domain S-box-containing protein